MYKTLLFIPQPFNVAACNNSYRTCDSLLHACISPARDICAFRHYIAIELILLHVILICVYIYIYIYIYTYTHAYQYLVCRLLINLMSLTMITVA